MDNLFQEANTVLNDSLQYDSALGKIQPLPDPLLPVDKFDYSLMPDGAFTDFIEDISERMQCPPDYVAVTIMTVLGAVIGRSHQINPKEFDDWVVVPNLWTLIIGRPSMMKTPALEEGMKPLKRAEIKAKEAYETELKQFDEDALFAEVNKKIATDAAKKLIKENKKDEAKALLNEANKSLKPPTRKRFIVEDATIEKLGELENQNPNGILCKRDEMSGFLRTIDNENRPNDRAFYLEGFNGTGSYCYDRIGRGTLDIPHHIISKIGTIQPGRYADYIGAAIKQGTGDDGLAQRYQLAVYPDEPPKWVNVDRYPDKESKNQVFSTIERLIDRVNKTTDPFLFRFNAKAQMVFNEFRYDLENNKLRNTDDHPALISHLAKYRSLMPSLALIIHLVDTIDLDEIPQVSEQAATKACAWCDYLESHARRIYSAATNNPTHLAELILAKIKSGKLKTAFTPRIIKNKHWSGLDDLIEIKEGLSLLSENNYLKMDIVKTGGRDSIVYQINPSITVKDHG